MRATDSSRYPLTLPQREVWFDQALHPERATYNLGGYLEIDREIDFGLLQRATREWTQRHDALRTMFHVDGSGASLPLQSWPREVDPPLEYVDLSCATDAHEAALQWMQDRMESRLPVAEGALFRCALVRLAPARHLWFLLCHHLIADGWTAAMLTRSLAEIYTALEQNDPPPAKTPPYAHFVEDDASYANSAAWMADEEFWRVRIPRAPEPIFLAKTTASCRSECVSVDWPRGWYEAIGAFAAPAGATAFHVVLAALYTYFVRTTARDELVLGLPVLNRSNAAFKSTAGMFVGMTPARFDFGTGLSFIELLRAIRRELRQGYRHQRFPISAIRRAAQTTPEARLFDISVSYERHDYAARYGTTPCKAHALLNGSEPTPLTLFIREFQPGEPVRCDHVFNTAWLDKAEVEAIQVRLRGIIDQAMAAPHAPIRSFALPTPAEREALRRCSTGPELRGIDLPYRSVFHAHATACGDRIAAVHGDDSITYAELDRRSNDVAAALASRGCGRDSLVALLAQRGIALLSMMLGVLKAGAAFVNLDPRLPPRRLRELIALSSAHCMLISRSCDARLEDILPDPSLTCLVEESLPPARSAAPLPDASPRDLAYAVFTSGSTGAPKCALVEHLGFMNNLLGTVRNMSITAADRIAQTAPVSFDVHVWQFLVASVAGGEVHVLPDDTVHDPVALLQAVDEAGITVLEVVPSMMRAMLDECPPDVTLASLRWLAPTGEALPPDLAVAWLERFPHVPLMHLYGPAECADNATSLIVATADEARACQHLAAMPIGRPLPNLQVQVLDEEQELLPPGALGEICIAGASVGRGYLNDAQRSAAAFVARRDAPGGRLYRTGDLGRLRADGVIEYAGRRDGQVKIRGQRIELAEVEGKLRSLVGVRDAAVSLHPDTRGQAQIVGYVVMAEPFAEAEIMRSLAMVLPGAMVPSRIIRLERLPLTPNGKLDRKTLPPPDRTSCQVEDSPWVPDATQAQLASVWAQLLRCDPPGWRDHFFRLGGDSLLAMQLASRVRRGWQIAFSLEDVFKNPELADMAKHVDSLSEHKTSGEELPPPESPTPRLPLSCAQARMWFLDKLDESSAAYNMPMTLHLRGALHVHALQQALNQLVHRHESLRTSIVDDGGELHLCVHASLALPLSLVDLSGDPDSTCEAKARSHERAEALKPFDLARAPLARATLLRLSDESHRLLLTFHHAMADGWSLQVLLRDLAMLYDAALRDDTPRLPAPERRYAHHVLHERRWLATDEARHSREHWRLALQGAAPVLNLPLDRPRRTDRSGVGAKLPVHIDETRTARLRELGDAAGATPFMTLAGIFGATLLRLTGQDDFCVGVPVAHREDPEFHDVVGLFVNTVPLRLRLDARMPFNEVLAATRESALQALSHAKLPFDQIIEACGVPRNAGTPPLVQAMFSLDDTRAPSEGFAGLAVDVMPSEHPVAKLDLTLELALEGASIKGCFEYNTDVLDASTVRWMSACLLALLDGACTDPTTPLSSVRMPERKASARSCVDLFNARAQETPMLFAVHSGAQVLTYDMLNTRADRLARRLHRAGVRPDDVVGLCASRSCEMVVAMLAVLKASGAYMPLDLALPAPRIQFQLDDAKPVLILGRECELAKLPRSGVPTISLDEAEGDDTGVAAPLPDLHPDSLAYVIYTSGSTGHPKAVGVTHGALGSYIQAMQSAIGLRAGQRVLQFTPISFDVSVDEIFLSLHAGACVVSLPADDVAPGRPLLDSLRRHGINVLFITPSALGAMSPEPLALDLIVVGGERCPRSLVEQWLPHCRMVNAYGPTEATVAASTYACRREERDPPIGTALEHTTLHVLDDHLDPVPVGTPGELFIGGRGVARGYLGRLDMTATSFLPDPFSSEPGARMYRTGDRVRKGSDGQLEFLGRLDAQVKLRGFRVELGEVESALCSVPGVTQAAVLLRDDMPGGPGLVAFIACSFPFEEQAIREALALKLPSYMVPNRLVPMPGLALNASGKIDRRALAGQPLDVERTALHLTDAPRTATECRLAAIWQDLLGVEQVERSDHFFGLGGHSLLVARLLSRIKSEFQVEFPMRAVFDVPVLGDMAQRIDTAAPKTAGETDQPLVDMDACA